MYLIRRRTTAAYCLTMEPSLWRHNFSTTGSAGETSWRNTATLFVSFTVPLICYQYLQNLWSSCVLMLFLRLFSSVLCSCSPVTDDWLLYNLCQCCKTSCHVHRQPCDKQMAGQWVWYQCQTHYIQLYALADPTIHYLAYLSLCNLVLNVL